MKTATLKKFSFGRAALSLTLLASVLVVIGALALLAAPGVMRQAGAAVTNYPPGVNVYAMPMHLNGPYTAASTTPLTFNLPYRARIIGFGAHALTLSGTYTLDFQANGVSLLSAPLTLSTAYGEATLSSATAIADEAKITAVVATTNTSSPSASGITILPTFLRR